MRDLGPADMRRFRHVERRFLEVTEAAGYSEVRTPTIEPLHLFTATGSLSPQLLDRVYSFLDWDGWSGERVVLRPDSTVPAARWYERQWDEGGPARLSYVQPVYRFVPGDGEREQWQCGVELFGLGAPEADRELLLLAREFTAALGVDTPRFELSHAGLMRTVLAAAGLDATEQLAAYDRLLDGDQSVTAELAAQHPNGAPALRLLFEVNGGTSGYLANLRAALLPVVPEADDALTQLEVAADTLDATGCTYRFVPGTARNFEYYTGLTFKLLAGDAECLRGGRYDGLGEAIGGRSVPASGFGADLLRLADIIEDNAR
jgi:histidyl-tRNA synthetase